MIHDKECKSATENSANRKETNYHNENDIITVNK